ncbi:MAG: hypothetical protein LBR67_08550 [Dysgonamonadaceae bacterium]|jgi:hypothetical protein|nr:hypothetical protein [Dysgonamonadaceae bacterium]
MKSTIIHSSVLFSYLLIVTANLCAQNKDAVESESNTGWVIGLNGGTYGLGIFGVKSISSYFDVRFVLEGISLASNKTYSFQSDNNITGMPVTGSFSSSTLNMFNVGAQLDIFPFRTEWICLTEGFFIGNNTISSLWRVDDYTIGQEIVFEGITVHPNPDGSFKTKIVLGQVIKPYFGLGIGQRLTQHKIGIRMDIGFVYQGRFNVKSDNISGTNLNVIADDVDVNFNKELLRWWPMLNFSIGCRF